MGRGRGEKEGGTYQPYLPAQKSQRQQQEGWGHTNTISKDRNDRGDRQGWEGGVGAWKRGGVRVGMRRGVQTNFLSTQCSEQSLKYSP